MLPLPRLASLRSPGILWETHPIPLPLTGRSPGRPYPIQHRLAKPRSRKHRPGPAPPTRDPPAHDTTSLLKRLESPDAGARAARRCCAATAAAATTPGLQVSRRRCAVVSGDRLAMVRRRRIPPCEYEPLPPD